MSSLRSMIAFDSSFFVSLVSFLVMICNLQETNVYRGEEQGTNNDT